MSEIILKIEGPFALAGSKSIFKIAESDLSGLYIFAFKSEDKYLIEYLGITTRDFKTRFLEHIRELLSGGYQLYDFHKLKNNKPFIIWKGRYGKDTDNIADFLDNYSHFSQIIKNHIQEYKIFLIPLKAEKRTLERIEAGIYKILRKQNNEQIMAFIKGVKFVSKREKEDPITVRIDSDNSFSKIPDKFEV